jgi:hypothetical protein
MLIDTVFIATVHGWEVLWVEARIRQVTNLLGTTLDGEFPNQVNVNFLLGLHFLSPK